MADIFDLLGQEHISDTTVQVVRQYCQKWNLSGFHGLLETNVMDEKNLADILAKLMKMDRIYKLADPEAGVKARQQVSYALASAWECLPNGISITGRLELVFADPTQTEHIKYFQAHLSCPLDLAVGTRSEIIRAIDDYYPLPEQLTFIKCTD